ncbi:geminin [Venturia canescens]|uniref:geminin n=1 Tax=Venturia canescens TaxID=32260 RepID=UPI001C9BD9B1|nr:geminin [Venturia canescens]
MKPGGSTQVSAAKTAVPEDKIRKSLHTLQPAATDKENLVGGGRVLRSTLPGKGSIKDEMADKTKTETQKRKKVAFRDKGVQTTRGEKIKIEVEDLTSDAGPSEQYWEVLAERRRIALEDALDENRELTERVARLEEEKRAYKEMLDETRALVEVLQEMIGEDRSDINNSLEDSVL